MNNFIDLTEYGFSKEEVKIAEDIAIAAAKRFPPKYMEENNITSFHPHSWVVYAVLRALHDGWS